MSIKITDIMLSIYLNWYVKTYLYPSENTLNW